MTRRIDGCEWSSLSEPYYWVCARHGGYVVQREHPADVCRVRAKERGLKAQLDAARALYDSVSLRADIERAEAKVWLREAVEHMRCDRGYPGGCSGRGIRPCHTCETVRQIRAFVDEGEHWLDKSQQMFRDDGGGDE